MQGSFPEDKVQFERITQLVGKFQLLDRYLIYDDIICVPRQLIGDIMHSAHDSSISGHFGFTKTMSRLDKFHGKTRLKISGTTAQFVLHAKNGRITEKSPLQTPNRYLCMRGAGAP